MEESENYAGVQHPKVTGLIKFTLIYLSNIYETISLNSTLWMKLNCRFSISNDDLLCMSPN